MDHEPAGCGRRTAIGCLLVAALVVLCGAVTTVVLDQVCYDTLRQRMPLYPGAEITTERHNLFRAWGMGETYIMLASEDPPEMVREWYGRTVGPYTRQIVGTPLYSITRASYDVTRGENGAGSVIRLLGTCVQ